MIEPEFEQLLRHLRDDHSFAFAVFRDTRGRKPNRTSETIDRYLAKRGASDKVGADQRDIAIEEAAFRYSPAGQRDRHGGQRSGGTTRQADGCRDKRDALARARRALVWHPPRLASKLAETADRKVLMTGAGGGAVAVEAFAEHVATMIEAGQDLSKCLATQKRRAESKRLAQHLDRLTEQLRKINERARQLQERERYRRDR